MLLHEAAPDKQQAQEQKNGKMLVKMQPFFDLQQL